MNELLIIIPAYNEEECICDTAKEWLQTAKMTNGRVLVINDGSSDQTFERLSVMMAAEERLTVLTQPQSGHGAAVVRGYYRAIADKYIWVFQVDSDRQYCPEDFKVLWKYRNHHDVVLGYRSPRKDPLVRRGMSFILRMAIFSLSRSHIKDSNIPFRLIRVAPLANLLEAMPMIAKSRIPNVLISLGAFRLGLSVCQLPVKHFARSTGTNSLLGWKLWRFSYRGAYETIGFIRQLRANRRELWLQIRKPY